MLALASAFLVLMNFTKNQNGVFKKYELPEKIRAQKSR